VKWLSTEVQHSIMIAMIGFTLGPDAWLGNEDSPVEIGQGIIRWQWDTLKGFRN